MAFFPQTTVPFLRERLRPAQPADPRLLARMIADLDSAEFDVRERATNGLEKLGVLAESALRKALQEKPSNEVERRINLLVDRLDGAIPSPEDLRIFRATAVLEGLGTPEARQLLKELSEGAADARITKEAISAHQRLNKRSKFAP
jgi:hypothetical protein